MNVFYNFATRSVHAPKVSYLHMLGTRVPVPEPGRVLTSDVSVDEACRMYGVVTGYAIS